MAFYRNVSLSFWTDSKVDDDFTPEDKYFFLYLMTNPHTNICGCYEISMRQMERETGYNVDTVKRLLHRMESTHNVIRYCEKTKEILIINWGRYNWSESEKVKKAVLSVAEHIKFDAFKKYVLDRVSIGYGYGMDRVSIDYGTIYTDTDTVTESESEHREGADKPRSDRFTPPSVEEVALYCVERKNGIDAQAFVDFYASKGWMIGKQKMKDWRAAVRTWENRRKQDNQKHELKTSSIDTNELDELFSKL